jgi:putative FmdB family regulatory protein
LPIYEYECQKCNKVTEAFQSVSDEPLTSCPDCHGSLKKLISSSSFQLKGGGWCADGYCSSKQDKCESNPSASSGCSKETAACPCTS